MNFYEILNISPEATPDQIKASFRELAKQYHPDRNPGNNEAEAKMKEINEAYSTLSDPQKRAEYDGKLNPNFESLFASSVFRAIRRQTTQIRVEMEISMQEVLSGGTREVELGLPEFKFNQNGLASASEEFAHKITFKFPPGCRHGVVVTQHFEARGAKYELLVEFYTPGKHEFGPNGDVLKILEVDYPTLVLGGTKKVLLLDGTEKEMVIPAGFHPFDILRVPNGGIPSRPNSERRGHLLFRVEIDSKLPQNIPPEALEALKLYKEKLEQVTKPQAI